MRRPLLALPTSAAPHPAPGRGGGVAALPGMSAAEGEASQHRLSLYTFSSRLELYVAEELWERLDRSVSSSQCLAG